MLHIPVKDRSQRKIWWNCKVSAYLSSPTLHHYIVNNGNKGNRFTSIPPGPFSCESTALCQIKGTVAHPRTKLPDNFESPIGLYQTVSFPGAQWPPRGIGEKTFNNGICGTWPGYLQIAGGVMRIETVQPPGGNECVFHSLTTYRRYESLGAQRHIIWCIKSGGAEGDRNIKELKGHCYSQHMLMGTLLSHNGGERWKRVYFWFHHLHVGINRISIIRSGMSHNEY